MDRYEDDSIRTFATSEKQSASRLRKPYSYVHYPLNPRQHTQQAAVHRILHSASAQFRLTIGHSNDKYEQEADRVADQVIAMPDRKFKRRPAEYEDKRLQTKSPTCEPPSVTPGLESRINSLKGSGRPLSASSRAFFEPYFGMGASRVRVHDDSNAADLSKSINANAFTVGRNVVFGRGQYAPDTPVGKKLIAHELTHVAQQAGKSVLNKSDIVQAKNNGKKLSSIKTVIIIGSPSKDQDKRLQFVYAAIVIGGGKNTIWMVEKTGYNKKEREFISKNKPGKLLWFNSTPVLISHLKRMKHSSIGEMRLFSHGTPSEVHLRYHHKKFKNYGFSLNNVKLFKGVKSKFVSDATITFDSCRAGAGKKKAMERSLAQKISDIIGIPVNAWLGRTSYRLTNKCYKKKLRGEKCKIVGSQYSPYYRWLGIPTRDDLKESKARSKGHIPRELKFYPGKFMAIKVDKSPLINNPVYLQKNKGKFKRYGWLKKGRVVKVLNKGFCNKWKRLTSKIGCWWKVLITQFSLGMKLLNAKRIKGWVQKKNLEKISPQDVK